jgi:restriction endonuclease
MKLKFKSQSLQTAAVNAVVDIFKGQRKSADTFTITNEKQLIMDENGMASAIVGTANVLQISDEKITENMNAVQKRFSLPVTNDQPQSVENTAKSKEAIASFNPLVQLRYSATHKEKINLLYRLTPVDAYQMGLVKQICVSSKRRRSILRLSAERLFIPHSQLRLGVR